MTSIIGTNPNQVPTNADLGTLAYQDYDVVAPQFLAGGRRNLIINGAMQVAQRGTSTTGVGSAGYYACDRWVYDGNSSAVFTMEQSTDTPDGFGNSFKVTTTTADGSLDSGQWGAIQQRIEGQDLQQLGFNTSNPKKFTVSFWVKSSISGGYVFGLYYDDGSSTSVRYTGKPYTIQSANTWEYKTITFDAPTGDNEIANDNTTGLRLYFCLSAGSNYTGGTSGTWGSTSDWFVGQEANIDGTLNATFQITGVQLELGDTATPFEHRSYGDELQRCQRYFQWNPTGVVSFSGGSNQAAGGVALPVALRSTPTITVVTGTDAIDEFYVQRRDLTATLAIYDPPPADVPKTSYALFGSCEAGATANVAGCFMPGHWTLDAEL